jgi:hypothetical protein
LGVAFYALSYEEIDSLELQIIPAGATDGERVIESKKREVAVYLINSFGLEEEQAWCVVSDAHWSPLQRAA